MTASAKRSPLARQIDTSFVDATAQQIKATWRNYGGSVERFGDNLRDAADIYFAAKTAASPNQIRSELKAVNSAASLVVERPSNYDSRPSTSAALRYRRRLSDKVRAVTDQVEALSNECRDLLRSRMMARASNDLELVDRSSLMPKALLKEDDQDRFCIFLASLTQTGRFLKQGRIRPGGKRSRPSPTPVLFAPPEEQNPSWRAHERELEMLLALAWFELTENLPKDDEAYRAYVENVFEQLGIMGVDIPELTKWGRAKAEMERQTRLNLSGAASARPVE